MWSQSPRLFTLLFQSIYYCSVMHLYTFLGIFILPLYYVFESGGLHLELRFDIFWDWDWDAFIRFELCRLFSLLEYVIKKNQSDRYTR